MPPAGFTCREQPPVHGGTTLQGPPAAPMQHRSTRHFTKEANMKRWMALLMLAMFSTAVLSGCNTMAGAGKDVQKVGEKVEDKAQDCKDGKC
jgi:predicted small secreted protein